MKAIMINALLNAVLAMCTPEMIRSVMDGLLDVIENAVEASENKTDDAIVLPLCKRIRDVFAIDDND